MNSFKNTTKYQQRGFGHAITFILVLLVAGLIGVAFWKVSHSEENTARNGSKNSSKLASGDSSATQLKAWFSDCQGNGKVKLTHAPMDGKDVQTIVPIGSLAGAHVTPIDHLYFYPKDMSNRDAAPVYAMADGYIVNYEERTQRVDTGESQKSEYQLYFQHNCNTLTYFDLMTSLATDIKDQIAKEKQKNALHIPIKAGQIVGYIGAQSLDTAVYNTSMTLSGFVNKDSYKTEPVKLHTDDFFAYFSGKTRSDMLALSARKIEPLGGKIDFDVDGYLRGNWFLEGSNGYAGVGNLQVADSSGKGYWSGHLAIVPDIIDPSVINISFGDYNGQAKQFSALTSSPDPAKVSETSGTVAYEYGAYLQPGPSMTGGVQVRSQTRLGVVLFKLTGKRSLKMEYFPGKSAAEIKDFTSAAKTYVR